MVELKVGDRLIPVSREVKSLVRGVVIVKRIGLAYFRDDNGCMWSFNWLDQFQKENKEPHNFGNVMEDKKEDLKSLVRFIEKAYFDNVLKSYFVGVEYISVETDTEEIIYNKGDDMKVFKQAIQSLYKESFQLKKFEDTNRIKKGAEITLPNGNKVTVTEVEDHIYLSDDTILSFFYFKDAIVEQSK